MKLDDAIEIVKRIHRIYVDSFKSDSQRVNHKATADDLGKVVSFLLEQRREIIAVPRDIGDISDLPPELVNELSVIRTDDLEDQIITIMKATDGNVSLDQILVGLYRNYEITQTRRFLQNKLYRMTKKELIFQSPNERGAYSLEKQDVERKETDDDDDTDWDAMFKDTDIDDDDKDDLPF